MEVADRGTGRAVAVQAPRLPAEATADVAAAAPEALVDCEREIRAGTARLLGSLSKQLAARAGGAAGRLAAELACHQIHPLFELGPVDREVELLAPGLPAAPGHREQNGVVDIRAPAHDAGLEHVDRADLVAADIDEGLDLARQRRVDSAMQVESAERLVVAGGQVARADPIPPLHHQHAPARLGEPGRDDRRARARPDDADVVIVVQRRHWRLRNVHRGIVGVELAGIAEADQPARRRTGVDDEPTQADEQRETPSPHRVGPEPPEQRLPIRGSHRDDAVATELVQRAAHHVGKHLGHRGQEIEHLGRDRGRIVDQRLALGREVKELNLEEGAGRCQSGHPSLLSGRWRVATGGCPRAARSRRCAPTVDRAGIARAPPASASPGRRRCAPRGFG